MMSPSGVGGEIIRKSTQTRRDAPEQHGGPAGALGADARATCQREQRVQQRQDAEDDQDDVHVVRAPGAR